MAKTKQVVLVAPKSTGGNFEYVAIPRQGLLYLSGALKQWRGDYKYDRLVWYEDRNGEIREKEHLVDADLLLITALINEAPRAYQIARAAKATYPEKPLIGGGPHMSPLAEEALREAHFDVIVQREGEDIIGLLCDILLNFTGDDRNRELLKVPGIAFLNNGQFVQTPRRGLVNPDFVQLPDFDSMVDLTPSNPLAAGVLETTRGCVENCSYCQVIQQFLGYRMIPRETEILRLKQLEELASKGLIFSSGRGKFSVFVSDDLHAPPLRATKFRDERFQRLTNWKGHTDNMWMIAQVRAEVGADPELATSMWEAGFRMLYVGVESDNAKNLELVRKRQEPGQVDHDLGVLNSIGFWVTAMTIIGLPYDTEESIMRMADWARTVSKYQTANLLTPLPATSNWDTLIPLDSDGSILEEGKMRPYELYTGRQFVHFDERWGLEESRELFDQYTSRLRAVDTMYERIFNLFKRHGHKLSVAAQEVGEKVSTAVSDVKNNTLSGVSSGRILLPIKDVSTE